MNKDNLFSVLGITPKSTAKLSRTEARAFAKQRYRELARLVHPDVKPGSAEQLGPLSQAHEGLDIDILFDESLELQSQLLARDEKGRQGAFAVSMQPRTN